MIWQDVILSVGQWIFVLALLPSVFGPDKPALTTSILTGSILLVFAATYATLFLWVSAFSAALVSLTWFVLAIQKYRTGKHDA